MPTSVDNYIFNELPRRLVVDPAKTTGSSLTASWLIVATGNGFQTTEVDPSVLGFEPEVLPGTLNQYYRGDKTWADLNAAAVGAIAASEKGQPLGVATLDADGFVQLSQMNPAVIERVVIVTDEAARYALTIADVQNGDVVNQQLDGNNDPIPSMWYVYDDQNLNNSSGYLPFSAGVAASVAWSGITGKPAIIGDLENITLASDGDVLQYVGGAWVNSDPASLKASLLLTVSDIDQLQDALDAKQDHSAVLDNFSAISGRGIVVRRSGGDFLGRELVGVNGIVVTEPNGEADNPAISLTETGVVAGVYGDEFSYPVIETDEFGRNISIISQPITRDPIRILDVPITALQPNTEHIFGNGVATYTSTISLDLPDNVPGGTWVKIKCSQDFVQAQSTVTITAPVGKTVQGASSFPFSSYFKLYPFSTIDLVFSSTTNNWTLLTNASSFLSHLRVVKQGATDGLSNSHLIRSSATSPRTLDIPDRDVDLSSVGQTDFADNVFRVSDDGDPSKKVAFSVGAITAGQTKVVTIPDRNVDLGLVGQTDFLDTAFRVSDNTDATKKIAFEASAVGTGQTRTITMPNVDVNLGSITSSSIASGAFVYTAGMGSVTKTLTASGAIFNIDALESNPAHSLTIRNSTTGNITCSFVSTKPDGFGSGLIGEDYLTFIGSYNASSPLGITLQANESWEIRYGKISGFAVYFTAKRSLIPLLLTSNLKFRNNLTTALGFTFAGTATSTDKVITLPDRNVDLGQQLISSSYSPSTGAITFGRADGTNTTIDMSSIRRYAHIPSGTAPTQPNVSTLFSVDGSTSIDIMALNGGKSWEFQSSTDVTLTLTKGTSTQLILDNEGNVLADAGTSSCVISLVRYATIKVTHILNFWVVDYGPGRLFARSQSLGLVSTAGPGVGQTKYKTRFARSSGSGFTSDVTVTIPDSNVDLGKLLPLDQAISFSDAEKLQGQRNLGLQSAGNTMAAGNYALWCENTVLNGTNNTAIHCRGVTTNTNQKDVTLKDVWSILDMTSPYIGNGEVDLLFPRGSKVEGFRRRNGVGSNMLVVTTMFHLNKAANSSVVVADGDGILPYAAFGSSSVSGILNSGVHILELSTSSVFQEFIIQTYKDNTTCFYTNSEQSKRVPAAATLFTLLGTPSIVNNRLQLSLSLNATYNSNHAYIIAKLTSTYNIDF